MRLGLTSVSLLDRSWDAALDVLSRHGIASVEADSGGHVPKSHFDAAQLVADERSLAAFRESIERRGIELAAFGCYGNPVHPDPARAAAYHEDFASTCELAAKLGIERVAVISGCPAGGPGDRSPNWILNSIYPSFEQAYAWQWDKRLIPYWREAASVADAHGVKICMELKGGEMVYNTETYLRLREAVGPTMGAHVDPSHLFWLGIDPLQLIRDVADSIYYVHAKDVQFRDDVVKREGLVRACAYADWETRSWTYRAVGEGHDSLFWRQFVSELRRAGYDDVVTIEIEEPYLSVEDAIAASVRTLQPTMPKDPVPTGNWFESYDWDAADA